MVAGQMRELEDSLADWLYALGLLEGDAQAAGNGR